MNRLVVILLAILPVTVLSCGGDDPLADYSLGTQTYPDQPDCKQAYYKSRVIPNVFLKKLVKADGGYRLEGIACHGVSIVIDVKTGLWREGKL